MDILGHGQLFADLIFPLAEDLRVKQPSKIRAVRHTSMNLGNLSLQKCCFEDQLWQDTELAEPDDFLGYRGIKTPSADLKGAAI